MKMVFLKTLVIDTSTDKSLAIFTQGCDVLLKILVPSGAKCSQALIGIIAEGMKQLDFDPQAVAVCVGPGSYTGIRVGVAAARGLAFPKTLPLVGFCSLEGFISHEQGKFSSVIDARLQGSYVLKQERIGEKVLQHGEPCFVTKADIDNYLKGWPNLAGPHLGYPDAQHLAKVASDKLFEYKGEELKLLYLRTPEYSAKGQG
jgi:tRNA threonylcarbamoyl adenosine modification protein YeaZ